MNNDSFGICLMVFNHDLRATTPTSTNNMCGVYYVDSGSITNMPHLNLEVPDNAIFFGMI